MKRSEQASCTLIIAVLYVGLISALSYAHYGFRHNYKWLSLQITPYLGVYRVSISVPVHV